jgi:hypothetical protein
LQNEALVFLVGSGVLSLFLRSSRSINILGVGG